MRVVIVRGQRQLAKYFPQSYGARERHHHTSGHHGSGSSLVSGALGQDRRKRHVDISVEDAETGAKFREPLFYRAAGSQRKPSEVSWRGGATVSSTSRRLTRNPLKLIEH